jgi:hypothetical protein
MKQVAAALALGLVVMGCGLTADRVQLVTGVPTAEQGNNGQTGCFLFQMDGRLIFDPSFGTEVLSDSFGTVPVAWRPGFTARRAGSEVEVLDRDGNVVAITGQRYSIEGGFVTDWPQQSPAASTFWACGDVHPLP